MNRAHAVHVSKKGSSSLLRWCGAIAGSVGLVVACADSKPPAKSPQGGETAVSGPTGGGSGGPKTAATADSPTSSSVRIDDAILKACGIPAPEAYFAFDSANLQPDDVRPLDKVATCFATGPMKGKVLKVIGHADPRGESEYNMALGQSRADAVAKYLQSRGVEKARAPTTSRGAMDATGTDEPSWAKDRRVDLMLP